VRGQDGLVSTRDRAGQRPSGAQPRGIGQRRLREGREQARGERTGHSGGGEHLGGEAQQRRGLVARYDRGRVVEPPIARYGKRSKSHGKRQPRGGFHRIGIAGDGCGGRGLTGREPDVGARECHQRVQGACGLMGPERGLVCRAAGVQDDAADRYGASGLFDGAIGHRQPCQRGRGDRLAPAHQTHPMGAARQQHRGAAAQSAGADNDDVEGGGGRHEGVPPGIVRPMDRPLHHDCAEGVLTLTLNRPERRNALSSDLVTALSGAIQGAASDDAVRAIVLTGAGGHFCAGGDLGGGGMAEGGPLGRHAVAGQFAALMGLLLHSPVPVVAAVEGNALGGGLGLVAACHLAVADTTARFGTPELKVGLFPMIIGPVLARTLPRKLLYEMVLCDRRLESEAAQAAGLVNDAVEAGAALSRAQELAGVAAARSSAVVGLGMRALAVTADLPVEAALDHMTSQLTLNLFTEDAAEGISAFLARRPPRWSGR
jgi:enoyl-CoA hydratase